MDKKKVLSLAPLAVSIAMVVLFAATPMGYGKEIPLVMEIARLRALNESLQEQKEKAEDQYAEALKQRLTESFLKNKYKTQVARMMVNGCRDPLIDSQ